MYEQIREKIDEDIKSEFKKLQEEVVENLSGEFTKKSLDEFIRNRITSRSELLLDTLVNYLMKQARKDLNSADVTLQNKFYDAKFREHIGESARNARERYNITPVAGLTFSKCINQLPTSEILNDIMYSTDPAIKNARMAGIIVLGTGTALSVISATTSILPHTKIVRPIVIGGATIPLTVISALCAYFITKQKSRESIKYDINNYLSGSEQQMTKWLYSVIDEFERKFADFCNSNDFYVEEHLCEQEE